MAINVNQLDPNPKVLDTVSSDPTTGSGTGVFYPKTVSGNVEGFYKDSTGNVVQITNNGQLNVSAGSGANTALSNLANVAINTALLPATDVALDLGSSSFTWDNVHAANLKLYGSTSGTITLAAAASSAAYDLFLPAAQAVTAGQVLANDGSGNLSWATPAGTGANTALSNLASVAINASLLPGQDNTIDAGSSSKRFVNIHGFNHYMYGVVSGAVSLEAANTTTSYSIKLPASQGSANTVLQNDGSGNLSWATVSSGSGANQALSNLSSVAINVSLLPGSDNSIDAGSSSKRFANVHTLNAVIYGSTSGNVNVEANATTTPYTIKLPAAQGAASTYLQNDGSGNLSWATVSGSGANTSLSNLSSVALNVSLLPGTDGAIDAGSATERFLNIHTLNALLYGQSSGVLTQEAATATTSYTVKWPASQGAATTYLKNDGSGNLSWATITIPAAGANTALSNLASVAINTSLLPGTDNSIDAGSSSKRFANVHTLNNVVYGATSGAVTIEANATTTPYTVKMPAAQGAASTFLQNDGLGNLSWQTASGTSGANTALSNLASVAINTSLLPGTDNSIDAGSASFRFANLHGLNHVVYGSTSGAVTIEAAAATTPYTVKMPAAQGAASTYLENDGAGNLSWATVSGGGGGTPVTLQRFTTTNTNDVQILGYGTALQMASITVTKTGNTLAITNVPSGVLLISAQCYFSGTDVGAATSVVITYPEPNGATTLATALLPSIVRFNASFNPFGTQAGSITISGSTITCTHSGGVVSNNQASLKLIF